MENRDLKVKYRPGKFSEIVGNQILKKKLKGMIVDKKIPRAVLIVGLPGTGKTTAAALLRRSLLCKNRAPEDIEPCGECESCKYPHHEFDFDCTSMTAESLSYFMESLWYPGEGPFHLNIKVLDEFHCCHPKVQNQFLKKLEERDHIFLIFCALDVEKFSKPFLQRVQVFYTYPPTVEELIDWLRGICLKENFTFETEALELIAQASDQLPRDCLNLLGDTSYSGQYISLASVEETLKFEKRLPMEKDLNDSLEENNTIAPYVRLKGEIHNHR